MNLASTDNYNDNNFRVGSRVQIQPEFLDNNCQHLALSYGEIKKIQGTQISVLLDKQDNKAYKPHIVHIPTSWVTLVGASFEVEQEQQISNNTDELVFSQPSVNIDPEFKNLILPLSDEEKSILEANLTKSGCLYPLLVWKGTGILLDGHNRYELCQKLQIPYKIEEVEIESRAAAICWIVNNQLGRRNITPEAASYLRGKRYLNLKGNREDNLKQNLPNGKNCRSMESDSEQDLPNGNVCRSMESDDEDLPYNDLITLDVAKELAEEYKVGERSIRNDANYAQAVDTLASTQGDSLKDSILNRTVKLPKKEILELAELTSTKGKEHVQKRLDEKLKKPDIVEQIKNKKRVPNPHHVGEVCRIISKGNPDLKPVAGAWCIVTQVNPHSCGIKTWKMDFPAVKPENLEITYGVCEQKAAENCDRILKLFQKVREDYEPAYMAILEVLSKVPDPSNFTRRQEQLLTILEQEYKL